MTGVCSHCSTIVSEAKYDHAFSTHAVYGSQPRFVSETNLKAVTTAVDEYKKLCGIENVVQHMDDLMEIVHTVQLLFFQINYIGAVSPRIHTF